jgi:hypothetical protein
VSQLANLAPPVVRTAAGSHCGDRHISTQKSSGASTPLPAAQLSPDLGKRPHSRDGEATWNDAMGNAASEAARRMAAFGNGSVAAAWQPWALSRPTEGGRNRNGRFWVSNGKKQTFVHGDRQRQPSTPSGGSATAAAAAGIDP